MDLLPAEQSRNAANRGRKAYACLRGGGGGGGGGGYGGMSPGKCLKSVVLGKAIVRAIVTAQSSLNSN
jgi:hypothetical protein